MQKQHVASRQGLHEMPGTFERETDKVDDDVRIERRKALAK